MAISRSSSCGTGQTSGQILVKLFQRITDGNEDREKPWLAAGGWCRRGMMEHSPQKSGDELTITRDEAEVAETHQKKRQNQSEESGPSKTGKCMHGRRKHRCKECGDSAIREHGRLKHECKECGGSGICEHGRQKGGCKSCRSIGASQTDGSKHQHIRSKAKRKHAEIGRAHV